MIQFNEKPPTLYSILESKVNYDNDNPVKIKNLAEEGREYIFDFNYPLTNKINKADFENIILNKFLMRRIEFETVTAFKIQLYVKLNEIMPKYNKMFDMLDGWDIFNDGEEIEKLNTGNVRNNIIGNNTLNNTGTDTLKNTGTDTNNRSGTDTDDLRNSELPQNEISNVKNGTYLTNYNLNEKTLDIEDVRTLNTENKRTLNITNQSTFANNNERIDNTRELITKKPSNKMQLYKDFLNTKENIYTMIFKDLECLFYGLL